MSYYNINSKRDIGRLPPSFLEDGSISLFYFFVTTSFLMLFFKKHDIIVSNRNSNRIPTGERVLFFFFCQISINLLSLITIDVFIFLLILYLRKVLHDMIVFLVFLHRGFLYKLIDPFICQDYMFYTPLLLFRVGCIVFHSFLYYN